MTPFTDGKRRRMHLTKLTNIGIVPDDQGAGANPQSEMVFYKSTEIPDEKGNVQKGGGDIVDLATSETDGHVHGIEVAFRDGELVMYVSYAQATGEESSHDHQLMRNENGDYEVLASAGHTHDVITSESLLQFLNDSLVVKEKAGEDCGDLTNIVKIVTESQNKEATMAKTAEQIAEEAKKAAENLEKMQASIDSLTAIAALSGVHKGHYDGLDEAGREAFVKMNAEDRDAAIKAAEVEKASADPVVYKSSDGTEYRQSHDSALVTMAKERDQDRKDIAALKAAADDSGLEKRANEMLPNLPGDLNTRKALLKSAEAIADTVQRDAAIAALKAHNDSFKGLDKMAGSSDGEADPDAPVSKGAEAELDTLAKERATKDGITFSQAYVKVSDENPELLKSAQIAGFKQRG